MKIHNSYMDHVLTLVFRACGIKYVVVKERRIKAESDKDKR